MVFPQRDRDQANAAAGDLVAVTLELELGHREVEVPPTLNAALVKAGLRKTFEALSYSKRKEFSRQVTEAKTEETRIKRIQKIIDLYRAGSW